MGKPIDLVTHARIWFLYGFLFYCNYFLLMPYILFRKKNLLYVVAIFFVITGTYLVKSGVEISSKESNAPVSTPWEKSINSPGIRYREIIKLNDQETTPRISFMTLYSLLLVFAASVSLRLYKKWQDDEERKREIEKERITAELSYLKQQINPHFLFNALNNIYSLTLKNSSPASDAVLKLSSILRYVLYDTDYPYVMLKQELEIIEDFIELQKLRLTESVKLNYSLSGIPENLKIAPLLFVPIIENAFKYGIDNVHDSSIDIRIKIESERCILNVKNSIVALSPENESPVGIGIKNIKRRLDLLYPGKYSFDTAKKDSTFNVELKINLHS